MVGGGRFQSEGSELPSTDVLDLIVNVRFPVLGVWNAPFGHEGYESVKKNNVIIIIIIYIIHSDTFQL